jgi:hypothetical protein
MLTTEKEFPDWNNLYKNQRVETMPWFNEKLDEDLKEGTGRKKYQRRLIPRLGYWTCNSGLSTC